MKKTSVGLIVSAELFLMGMAHAGSMGAAEPSTWTGVYLGANGGGGWGNPSVSMTYILEGQVQPGISWYPTKVHQNFSGAIFGGQIGYNYQFMSQLVLGIKYDTDLSKWTAYSKTPSGDTDGAVATLYSVQQLNWFAHVLPRLGYLFTDNLLFYGTGGLVFGSTQGVANQAFNYNVVDPDTTYPGSFKSTPTGWSAGAGLEWKVLENWSLAVEYLYNDLGNKTIYADQTYPSGYASSYFQNQYVLNMNFQTVSLAVNYHW